MTPVTIKITRNSTPPVSAAGTPVHADNWEINGCPVNGPAIAARGKNVAVAWFAAKDNAPKTQLAFSKDGGRTFGAPIRIDSGTTLGRVGLTLLADGRALVSWIDSTGVHDMPAAAYEMSGHRLATAGYASPET